MRHLKLIRAIMAVTLFSWGLFCYTPSRASAISFTPTPQDPGGKTWLVASYDDDDDDGSDYGDSDYDDGDYDDGGYDDGGDDD